MPNGSRPCSQRGGTIRWHGKSCFPHSTVVFVQTVQTVSPRPPCSPLLSMLTLFFLFSLSSEPVSCDVIIFVTSTSPRPHTGDILSAPPQHCNYCTNPVAATTAATSPFAGSRAPTGLALSHTRHGHTQATLAPSPSLSPQPPPPQCLYNQHHFPNPVALQPASPDFATQTGGAKGALAPTISVRPPFAHPPPLCRSFHSCGCPCCAPRFTCPALPTVLPCMLGGAGGTVCP